MQRKKKPTLKQVKSYLLDYIDNRNLLSSYLITYFNIYLYTPAWFFILFYLMLITILYYNFYYDGQTRKQNKTKKKWKKKTKCIVK